MIYPGGRTLLSKLLKGSREKKLLDLELDQSPSYGFYRHRSNDEILARIDRVIADRYLSIEYSGRLPMLVFTQRGWAIEVETLSDELFADLSRNAASGPPWHLRHLVDRNRQLILLLLDKMEATGDAALIPLLEAWEAIECRKVRARIRRAIQGLQAGKLPPPLIFRW